MNNTLLSAKLDYLLNYAKKQYSVRKGLHLNSKDWESYVDVKSAMFYTFLTNGTVQFLTKSKLSGKSYKQYVKFVDFKKFEPALLLLFLIDTPEDKINNFLKTFLQYGEVKLFCEDPSFLFWGSKYNLTQIKSCYGPGENRPPDIRDPLRNFLVCKHLWLVLDKFEKSITEFIKELLPYYKAAFGLHSPTGLKRLKKNLGDKGLKRVIEEAIKNINKLKSDEVKKLFKDLTAGKLDSGIKEKFNEVDKTKEEQDKTKAKEEQNKTKTKETAPKTSDVDNNNENKAEENQTNIENEDNTEDGEV